MHVLTNTPNVLDPGEPSPEDMARARAFIAKAESRFRFARSVPEAPHWYLVRSRLEPDLRNEFDWFRALIHELGYTGTFWDATWTYLDMPDGFKYWTSREWYGESEGAGGMLNRAKLYG
jgi:hypothetical protein